MRLDARIPVLIVPVPGRTEDVAALADGDERGVLLLVGDVGDWLPGAAPQAWAVVRRLAFDALEAPLSHAAGCACCAGRAPLAVSLSELFRQRATGELTLFRRVTLVLREAAMQAASDLLLRDPLVAGRYRRDGHEQKFD